MRRQGSIRTRLLVGYLSVAFLAILISWLSYAQSRTIYTLYRTSVLVHSENRDLGARLNSGSLDIAALVHEYSIWEDPAEKSRVRALIEAEIRVADELLQQLEERVDTAGERQALDQVSSLFARYRLEALALLDLRDAVGPFSGSALLAVRSFATTRSQLGNALAQFDAVEQAVLATANAEMGQVLNSVLAVALASGIAAALITVAAGLYLSLRILTPLRHLHEGAQAFGRGELAHTITVRTGDELEVLGNALTTMAGRLRESLALEREQNERLHTTVLRYRLLVENSPLGIISTDRTGQVVDVNPKLLELLGSPSAEAMRAINVLDYPPLAAAGIADEARRCLEGRPVVSEHPYTSARGKEVYLRLHLTPIRDEEGQVTGMQGLAEDISARRQAEEALRQAKDAAEAANRAKSAFLANMSHELRTPLNAILGFAQLLGRDPTLTTEQRDNLETIGRSGEHLLALINDVLEMSKIEAGRATLSEQSFDLPRLLTDLESMFRLRAADKGLELLFECDTSVPRYVRADEGKLRQILINLLSNAVKFTQEGHVTLRAHLGSGAREPGSPADSNCLVPYLHVEVEDTGVGITPAEQSRIFQPFVQTASGQQAVEGTGLGLAICQHYVRLMAGHIWLRSTPGQGSVFGFHVPGQLAAPAEVGPRAATRRALGLEPGQPIHRLLVVEDREANRKLLVKLLTSLGRSPDGFEVREAANGQEAVRIWQEWAPHLVWMDMRMPVMDGYEATRRIKATIQGQATVVIALTASAFEEDRAAVLAEGCDDFVRKPFREHEIVEKLAQHLGVRFVYDEAPTEPHEEKPLNTQQLTVLGNLPAAWVARLYHAALQADADQSLALIEEIRPQHGALAEGLTQLVQNYRFDILAHLAQPRTGG